jgi:dTDP-D-glucose 4,6-dehydratase
VAVLERRRIGESYNIGGNSGRTNLEVVAEVSAAIEELMPSALNPALPRDGRSFRAQDLAAGSPWTRLGSRNRLLAN